METFVIKAVRRGICAEKDELVTEEVPLTIEVNGGELATLLCSPVDLKELVIGFLYTSGLMEDFSAIKSLTLDQERWKAYVDADFSLTPELLSKRLYTSGCGKGIIFYNPLDLMSRTPLPDGMTVVGEDIFLLMKKFLTASEEYRRTGGVHSCALAKGEDMIFKDDIGRHNALDKVIGAGLQRKIDFASRVMLTSGRVSSEIVSKALRCRLPVLATGSAPTNQAVKLARAANLTLLGFVRGQRMNVYSGEQRIICRKAES